MHCQANLHRKDDPGESAAMDRNHKRASKLGGNDQSHTIIG